MSAYYLEHADVDHIQKNFDDFEEEARSLLSLGLPIPAYVWTIYMQIRLDYKLFSDIDKLDLDLIHNELGMIRFWRPLTLSIF